jgi:hypothetical protein
MLTKILLLNNNRTFTILATAVLLVLVQNVYAQPSQKNARNTVYADFASEGAVYSINYDRIFNKGEKINISYRVGVFVLNDVIAFPIGIQFFTGQYASHIEFSLTVEPYIEKYQDIFDGNNVADKKAYIMPGVGYRYQRPDGGFFAKVVVGPMIYLDPPSNDFWNMDTLVYAGITAGVGFSF